MLVLLIILHIRFDTDIQMLEIRINPGSGAFADTVWMNSLLCRDLLGGRKAQGAKPAEISSPLSGAPWAALR